MKKRHFHRKRLVYTYWCSRRRDQSSCCTRMCF